MRASILGRILAVVVFVLGAAGLVAFGVFLGAGTYASCPSSPSSATVAGDGQPTESTYSVETQRTPPLLSNSGVVDIVNDKSMDSCQEGEFVRLKQDDSGVWKTAGGFLPVFPNKAVVIAAFYGSNIAAAALILLAFRMVSDIRTVRKESHESAEETSNDEGSKSPDEIAVTSEEESTVEESEKEPENAEEVPDAEPTQPVGDGLSEGKSD